MPKRLGLVPTEVIMVMAIVLLGSAIGIAIIFLTKTGFDKEYTSSIPSDASLEIVVNKRVLYISKFQTDGHEYLLIEKHHNDKWNVQHNPNCPCRLLTPTKTVPNNSVEIP